MLNNGSSSVVSRLFASTYVHTRTKRPLQKVVARGRKFAFCEVIPLMMIMTRWEAATLGAILHNHCCMQSKATRVVPFPVRLRLRAGFLALGRPLRMCPARSEIIICGRSAWSGFASDVCQQVYHEYIHRNHSYVIDSRRIYYKLMSMVATTRRDRHHSKA